jgi:branched-chain amino acid transport system substrate-binding protein
MLFRIAVAALTLTASLSLCAQTSAVTNSTLTLHHIGPFTGQLAASNAEGLKGAEVFFDSVNLKGGINGRQIKIKKLDDKQDGKESARLVKELVDQREVLAIFMPRTTPSTQSMMAITDPAGVPMVGAQAGAIAVTEPLKRNVFTMRASYQDEVIFLIKLLHQTGSKRFGFLVASDALGKDVMTGVDKVMKELKLQPNSVQPLDQQTPEVSGAVDKMLGDKPDAIVMIGGAKGVSDFVALYQKKGGFAKFATLSNNGSDSFVKTLGDYKRGVIITQIVPSPNRRTSRLVREYIDAMAAAKAPPSFVSLHGYIAAKVLAEGLRRAGRNLTPQALSAALDGLGAYDLGDYRIEFNSNQRLGSKFVEASIISVDGKMVN